MYALWFMPIGFSIWLEANMTTRFLFLFLTSALGACATAPMVDYVEVERDDLLSGRALFGEKVLASEMPDVDVLQINDDMRAFIADGVSDANTNVSRLGRLLSSLIDDGYYEAGYEPSLSQTAEETFATKRGNCLSYTNLFIAMAREAGLIVHFQIAKVPPTYDAVRGVLIRNNHVNILVEGGQFYYGGTRDVTIDFNLEDPSGYPTKRVSDGYGVGLYYNNVSVERWKQGELRAAFVYLLKAFYAGGAQNADLWVNLGVYYLQGDHYRQAVEAFRVALALDSRNQSAIGGLGRAFEGMGDVDQAAEYDAQLSRHRRRNPYYHFARAQLAFGDQRYDESLDILKRAIRLRDDDHRFYYLQGMTFRELGIWRPLEAVGLGHLKNQRYIGKSSVMWRCWRSSTIKPFILPTDFGLRFGKVPTFTKVVHVDHVFNRFATHWTVIVAGVTDREHAKNVVGIRDSQELSKFLFVG
jgi:tetratricopeptide (TPR) repeat protein